MSLTVVCAVLSGTLFLAAADTTALEGNNLTVSIVATEGSFRTSSLSTLQGVANPLSLKDATATCTLQKHNDTASGFWSGYADGIRTVTYFDPVACGGVVNPFQIQALSFTLYDPGGYQWPVTVDVVVYDVNVTGNPCDGPGPELCRFTVTCDSATWSLPNVGTAWFPEPCCVTGPFFIGIEYNDGGAGPFPSVLFSNQASPDTCDNWQYYTDANWYEWYNFWQQPGPGYPLFWVQGETESQNCGARVVINELLYAPGETGRRFDLHDHEWVEIYNAGYDSADLTGWTVSNRDGTISISLPSIILPPGCFLTLHQDTGTNDFDFDDLDGHFYTGDTAEIFDDAEDECALYSGAPDATTIMDFVAWSNKITTYIPGVAHGYAVSTGIWTFGDCVNSEDLVGADCLTRYFDGYDRDIPDDWQVVSWTVYAQNRPLQPENPIQITPLNRSVISDATPSFDWVDFPGADSYRLQVDNNWDFSSPEIDVSGLTTSQYTPVTSLTDDAYFWRVQAFVGGLPTPWAAEWLLVIQTAALAPQGRGGQLSCPHKWQRKDTELLCIWEQRASTRPGCVESGNHAWDKPHPDQSPGGGQGCPHDVWYCARASIAMVNAKYGGDLSQDRISYNMNNTIRAQPEGDLGHNIGVSDPTVTNSLSWALNGAAINYQFVGSGNFTFAQIQGWINQLDCFVAGVPGHCLVIDGYAQITSTGGTNIQIVYSQDPWRGPNDPSVFSYVINGAPARYRRRHRNNSFDAVWLQPASGVTARMQEAAVTTDSDGDGIMDFDEQNPRNFDCISTDTDTDDDEVLDKDEIRNYTFHDQAGYHPGHENDPLNFPDIDGDSLRAEGDCDSDNDADFDGGEDINGDGHNPVPAPGNQCTTETCQFDSAQKCIKVAVNKDTYYLGEPIYIVDQHFTRETHTYHANSTYNYEYDLGTCPSKSDSAYIRWDGSFTTDSSGHAITKLVTTCLFPGQYYLYVDVLSDHHYNEPDNWDPWTCWTCEYDWFHGWHWGYDFFPYHNPEYLWPQYEYPSVCVTGDITYQQYIIECPWWWWCYEWPPVLSDYWLGVAIPVEIVDLVLVQPPILTVETSDCSGIPIAEYIPSDNLTTDLQSTFPDPSVVWFGFMLPNWQLTDSLVVTRVLIDVPNKKAEQLQGDPIIRVVAGDLSYGWSPTVYDSILLSGFAGCCVGIRGNVDFDTDDQVNVADLTYLVDYLFRGGLPPECIEEANVDGDPDENINVADLTYLVDYLFRGGPSPQPCP
jgi:hypothetical protein